jgi:ABC-type nitrate/sulfonate/bicarbonate transport system substrate-binding protein
MEVRAFGRLLKRPMIYGVAGALVTTAMVAGTSGLAGAKGKKKALIPITIGVSAAITVESLPEVALKTGEFAKEGLTVTVQKVTVAAIPQLLGQGQVEFVDTGLSAALFNAYNEGVDLRIIGNAVTLAATDPSGLYVNTKFLQATGSKLVSPLPSGFTLSLGAVGAASISAYWTGKYLAANGDSFANTSNVNLGQATIETALKNGAVDAGFVNDPYSALLKTDKTVKLVAKSGAALVYESAYSYLETHASVAQKMLEALILTTKKYMSGNYYTNATTMNDLSAWIGIPTATIVKSPAPVFLPDLTLSNLKTVFNGVQPIWIKTKIESAGAPILYTALTYPGPLKAAVKALKKK